MRVLAQSQAHYTLTNIRWYPAGMSVMRDEDFCHTVIQRQAPDLDEHGCAPVRLADGGTQCCHLIRQAP
jgi:hypothetical protein